jgi:DNA-binding beta-propeller fold protein YncE
LHSTSLSAFHDTKYEARVAKLWGATFFVVALLGSNAASADCNQAMPDAVSHVVLPGHPFAAIPTADGCTIFVSLTAKPSQLVVLKRDNGAVTVGKPLDVDGLLTGMALSPDGRILAAANASRVLLFDAIALAGGQAAPPTVLDTGPNAATIYAAFSPDGRLLAVANEDDASLSLYDVSTPAAARPLGQMKTGRAPVGLIFSADGALLYSTSEVGPPSWTAKCQNESHPNAPHHSEGILLVFDVAKAAADPRTGMLAGVAAGCNAVRVALSADGKTAYVTSRGGNAVQAFDTAALRKDPAHALITSVIVGTAPVGLAVGGGQVFVTNSNRFSGGENQSVSVLDGAHPDAQQRAIPAGNFPRELKITADGNTLLVTNFKSGSLELVDLQRLGEIAK